MVDHLSIQLYPIQFRIYFTTTQKWKAADGNKGNVGCWQCWCTVGCECWNKLLWQCIKHLMSHSPNQEYVDSYRLFLFWLCASAHLILNPILDLLIQSNIKITLSLPYQDANCMGSKIGGHFFHFPSSSKVAILNIKPDYLKDWLARMITWSRADCTAF